MFQQMDGTASALDSEHGIYRDGAVPVRRSVGQTRNMHRALASALAACAAD